MNMLNQRRHENDFMCTESQRGAGFVSRGAPDRIKNWQPGTWIQSTKLHLKERDTK